MMLKVSIAILIKKENSALAHNKSFRWKTVRKDLVVLKIRNIRSVGKFNAFCYWRDQKCRFGCK